MKIPLTALCVVFLFPFMVFGQQSYSYTEPTNRSDGWNTHNLLSEHIDSTKIFRLFNQLNGQKHRMNSVLLVREGQLEIEEYFNESTTDTRQDLRSVTKSIISILMGIAVDKGFVRSIDDPVLHYIKSPLPEKNKDIRKNSITIRHLLTMSTGLDCNDWDKKSQGQEDKVYRKKDWLQYTLNLPQINDPGVSSMYCTMGVVLAAKVISQASGMTIAEFAQWNLFDPLGITNVLWGHTTTGKEIIPSAKRLYMTPRDMAKIGQLVLNRGKWNSEQLVSENWIQASTSRQTTLSHLDYGLLWWKIPFKINDQETLATVATGNGGQYIMIFPEFEMVAVFTGEAYNSEEDKLPFAIVRDVFLPLMEYLD